MSAFRHEALLYAGDGRFVDATAPFIRDGIAAGEPIMVAVSERKADLLRAELESDAEHVQFVDMERMGRNPACIIPAWDEFVARHAGGGRRLRGIGEPIWPARTPDELVECHHHESLLNLAFDAAPMWLVCPYDVEALEPEVLAAARRTHPLIAADGETRPSGDYLPPDRAPAPFDGPLPPPPMEPEELLISEATLPAVRGFAARHARRAGLTRGRTDDLMLALNELATNSIRHAGGRGILRAWEEPDAVVFEVIDGGRFEHPLTGRTRPDPDQYSGRGLLMVNHLCDLVQIRSHRGHSVVRVRMNGAGRPTRAPAARPDADGATAAPGER